MKRWALAALVACHPAPPVAPPLALSGGAPIAVDTGPTSKVVEQGDALYVLGGPIATIVRGGAVAARIESSKPWAAGATIAAPDGEGRWVVAADQDGVLWRLMTSGEREQIADRLGLDDAHVTAIGGAGTTSAFDLGNAVAYTTDGVHLTRVPAEPAFRFAVARGVLARAVQGGAGHGPYVERWDLAHATRVKYPIAATDLAFLDADSDHPRLVAGTRGDLFVADATGTMHRIATPSGVHDLAVRGDRLWIDSGDHLYLFDHDALVPTTVAERPMFLLGASPTGDAWLGTSHGLVRYSAGAAHEDPAWQAEIAPVFQRVCSHCHLPGGDADFDLSTQASWLSDRDEIARRVLVTRTMPPAGTDLSDADRAAIAAWLGK